MPPTPLPFPLSSPGPRDGTGLAAQGGAGVNGDYGPASDPAMLARRAAAFQRWGIRPPALAPLPPAVKPALTTQGTKYSGSDQVPVIARVPTADKVVFLTIDDGSVKDPEFVKLLQDLRVPVSSFLTHDEARSDYGYFRGLTRLGDAIHNHTITHSDLPKLPYDLQHDEICRQQDNLEGEFGVRPRLFRPPYGDYNQDTVRAAKDCGVQVLVMWSLEAWANRIDWQASDNRLRPGDIILTHYRGPQEWGGTMNDMMRRMLGTIAEQGFAVARIEDYL